MSSTTKPTPFGNYLLLDLIAAGGMAEVFRAATVGFAGFQRLIAIKRILAQCAADKHFINMLIDEARIAVQLSNPNIVQILELGVVDGKYYIAMEYVAGRDLRYFMTRLMREKTRMPVPVAAYVVSGVCSALDHAHRKCGPDGLPLNIVHRDVSPHNVLVGFDGSVKVTDFGIAKAENRVSQTLVGTIKGKFSYMAPDQVRGEELDHRADIFCTGILLYELLTGTRLFGLPSDVQNLQAIRQCKIAPPRTLNPAIPVSLERVVMKALAPFRENRYQWASEMFDDLQPFLIDERSVFTAQKLRAYLEGYEPAAIAAERQHTEELMRAAEGYGRTAGGSLALSPREMPTAKLALGDLQAGAVILAVGTGERSLSVEISMPDTNQPALALGTAPVPEPMSESLSGQSVTDRVPAPEPSMPAPEPSMPAPEPSVPAPEPSVPTPELPAPVPRDTAKVPVQTLPADDLGSPTVVEAPLEAGALGPDTTPGVWVSTAPGSEAAASAEEITKPVPPADSPFGGLRTLVVEPVDKPFRQEVTEPGPTSGLWLFGKPLAAQWPWLAGGAAVLLFLGALLLWPESEPVAEVPAPQAPVAQAAAVTPPSPHEVIVAASAAAPEPAPPSPEEQSLEQARVDLLAMKKAIDAQIRKLELLVGDLPALDQQRNKMAALTREDHPVEALEVAAKVLTALDAVGLDAAFVIAKLDRFDRLAKPVDDEVLRLQVDEVKGAASAALQAGDYKLANRHLNRGFRLLKGTK